MNPARGPGPAGASRASHGEGVGGGRGSKGARGPKAPDFAKMLNEPAQARAGEDAPDEPEVSEMSAGEDGMAATGVQRGNAQGRDEETDQDETTEAELGGEGSPDRYFGPQVPELPEKPEDGEKGDKGEGGPGRGGPGNRSEQPRFGLPARSEPAGQAAPPGFSVTRGSAGATSNEAPGRSSPPAKGPRAAEPGAESSALLELSGFRGLSGPPLETAANAPPPPLPPAGAFLLEQAVRDEGLMVAVLPRAAHISIQTDDGRALELHLRLSPEGAHIRASGALAPMIGAQLPALGLELAAQGLTLSGFELGGGERRSGLDPEPADEDAGTSRSVRPLAAAAAEPAPAAPLPGRIHLKL